MPKTKLPAQSEFDKFLTGFEKAFGKETLVVAEKDADKPYEVISSGSMDIDDASGVGGYVRGRLIEIWGNEAAGKSTLALMAVAEAQKAYPNLHTGWIDMEHVFDKPWARDHGVDLTRHHIFTPDSAEDVADAMKELLMSGLFSMVVLDSIGAMLPEAEKEKDADKAVMAAQAKIVTRMVKIAAVVAYQTGAIPLFINQVRANLGYGADTMTGGGFALKHATTMRLKVSRTSSDPFKAPVNGKTEIVGHEIKVNFERNKVSSPHRTATLSLFNYPTEKYGPIGLDKVDEAVTVGIRRGAIEQNGGWYILPTGEKVNGRDAVVEALRADPTVVDLVRERVIALNAAEVIIDDHEADLAALDGAE